MNPKQIASELKAVGCPFSCQYIDYNIELLYKKIDTSIDPDELQLTFYLDGESSWPTTVKDLDYTYDMLASDYGAIFGLFLGLSLIDTMVYLFAALKAFVFDVAFVTFKSKLKLAYTLIKWLLVTGLIGLLIALMFSTDFKNLGLFVPDQIVATNDVSADFLNPNSNVDKTAENDSLTIKWGSDVSGLLKVM